MASRGDFNDIFSANDKFGGNPINHRRSNTLWNNINKCNLLDLGYKGCKYALTNNRKKSRGLIMERLDRIFVNNSWLSLFSNAMVIHLPRTHSNHSPLLVQLSPKNVNFNNKSFRLETIKCRHPDFINIVKQCWSNDNLTDAQIAFRDIVLNWKNETFGDIFKKKKNTPS